MNNIFQRAAAAVHLMMNGFSSNSREIVWENGDSTKYWLQKTDKFSSSPLELVIRHRDQSEERINLRRMASIDDTKSAIAKFNQGEMMGDIFFDLKGADHRAGELSRQEESVVYYQYRRYGQTPIFCAPANNKLNTSCLAYTP